VASRVVSITAGGFGVQPVVKCVTNANRQQDRPLDDFLDKFDWNISRLVRLTMEFSRVRSEATSRTSAATT